MYCKLLEEAVEKLRQGKKEVEAPKPDPTIDLQVEAYIDGGYIDDAMHKIELYQRIAAIRTDEELHNLLDELIDRFGEPTKPVMNLLAVARIKNHARALGLRSLAELPQALDIYLLPDCKLPVKGLLALDKMFGRTMKALPGKHGYRFALNEKYKQDITNFATRLLLAAAGDETAMTARKTAGQE